MFYRPENGHGLPHNPFNAIVAPRPIGWISTRGEMGDNLAPYSFFNAVAYTPPQVVFSSVAAKGDRQGTKDSLAQIMENRFFCVNIPSAAQVDAVNASSAAMPAGMSEFEAAGIESAPCETIPCLRVKHAPASLECRATQIVPLAGQANYLVIGVVTGIHLRDDCIIDGRFKPAEGWLARLGYKDYAAVTELFERERPA
ncbi:MAG: flavin reductase family protein [Paracoccus sp. (in: a-proteobacteria)]|nr:flavin reductase family protein [Paracoccus sp. (in: a-proteobacteria)]